MSKSKEYIEGFKDALQAYSWMDNDKRLRVGIPGRPLKDAIEKIENEMDPEVVVEKIEEIKPDKSVMDWDMKSGI